jgi:hypothetical protein
MTVKIFMKKEPEKTKPTTEPWHADTIKLGKKVYIYLPHHKGDRTQGEVIHMFDVKSGLRLYVIEIQTSIDPLYEVRSQMEIWDTPSESIVK